MISIHTVSYARDIINSINSTLHIVKIVYAEKINMKDHYSLMHLFIIIMSRHLCEFAILEKNSFDWELYLVYV